MDTYSIELYVGQSSIEISRQIQNIRNLLHVDTSNLSLLIDHWPLYPSSKRKREPISITPEFLQLNLCHCVYDGHTTANFCRVCFSNYGVLKKKIREIVETNELIDRVTIMTELGSPVGSKYFGFIMQFIKSISSTEILSILIKPPLGIGGINSIEILMQMNVACNLSDAIMIRGNEEPTNLLNDFSQSNSTTENSLDQWHFNIATDLIAILTRTNNWTCSNYFDVKLWPLDICSSKIKVIDIRTSLHGLLKKIRHQIPSKVEYYPVRSMISNLQNLHQSYRSSTPEFFNDESKHAILVANHQMMKISTPEKGIIFSGQGVECNVAWLKWATPSIQWPAALCPTTRYFNNLSDKAFLNHDASSKVKLYSTHKSKEYDTLSYSSSSTSTSSIMQSKLSAQVVNDLLKSLDISTIVFDSLYARADLHTVCQNSKKLLDIGAYISSKHTGYTTDELNDAIYVLESFCHN